MANPKAKVHDVQCWKLFAIHACLGFSTSLSSQPKAKGTAKTTHVFVTTKQCNF